MSKSFYAFASKADYLVRSSLSVEPLPSFHRFLGAARFATQAKSGAGIQKPIPVSREMEEVVGVPEISRAQAMKQIWAYIKAKDLQDPDNKRVIVCDEQLKRLFGGKDRVGMLEMPGLITTHFKK